MHNSTLRTQKDFKLMNFHHFTDNAVKCMMSAKFSTAKQMKKDHKLE
jgi:hypothetical protein